MKYSYFKNENGNYAIRHTDSVTEAETLIAFTDDAEKADFLCKAANSFKYNGTQLKEAVEVLCDALMEDKSEGSYYFGWQANIAVQFKDEFERQFPMSATGYLFDLHKIANNAAKNFLDSLIRDAKNDYPDD